MQGRSLYCAKLKHRLTHSISDDLYIESPADTIDKYLKVFKDIFVMTRHEEHYNMMMGIET